MKRKKELHLIMALMLLLILSGGVLLFSNGISRELWTNSIQTMTEHMRQGANAINIQFETDFYKLETTKESILRVTSSVQKQILAPSKIIDPDVTMYLYDDDPDAEAVKQDYTVRQYLEKTDKERGILDSHINSMTGESVFNIFVRVPFRDGTRGYLVKEYRAKDISKQFTLSFYDNNGFSYLVNRDGTIMVRPQHRNSNKTNHNLFDFIASKENDESMITFFRDSIYGKKSGWAKFVCEGTDMVFCYEPLEMDSDWLMVSIVPESVITAQTKSILTRTLIFSGFLGAVVLVLVAYFSGIIMHETRKYNRELRDALEIADKADKAKSHFLMNMSHDIRTPLNAIIGMTLIAQDNRDDKERVDECLEKINLSGKHLVSFVNDLLDMSQIENGEIILKEETVSISQIYNEVINLMKLPAMESNITMEPVPAQLNHETVVGDPIRIRQVMINIISNAIKYTPSGGLVSVELTQSDKVKDGYGIYRFRCTDTGIGIEPELLEKMFLSFERGRNTTHSGIAGMGVGLSITKGLLDIMKGSISVESEPDKGSTFIVEFRFLLQEDEAAADEANIQTAAITELSDAEAVYDYSDKHILLVDDVELNMEIMEALLEMIGANAEKACNGKEAVDLVRTKPCGYYSLIFMDIQMPVMDGYEATRQIRAMDREDAKTIPIIALSANALAEDVQNAKLAGMNDHIAKPVDIGPIEKTLQQYIK